MRLRKTSDSLVIISILLATVSTVTSTYSSDDPCLDGEIETDAERLKLPSKYANLTPPWRREDGKFAKVVRSQGLNYLWGWVKSLKVKTSTKTVEDVIQFLNENQCLFVPVGPFVRKVLLGQKTVYVSGEVSCDLHQLYNKCVSHYGFSKCALYPVKDDGWGAYRLEIGDAGVNMTTNAASAEPIVLYEWRSMLGAPRDKWRFTIDTLALFDDGAGDLFLIDPTGYGYKHVCDKKIYPADSDWTRWSQGQEMKVMGFYDLRSDGFAAHNETFQKFVNKKIKESDKRVGQQFYCEHVLKGVANLEGSTPVCHTMYPEKEVAGKIAQMRTIMINEMDVSWNSSIGKAAEDLEAVFCTPRQFADIRARLQHKLTSHHDIIHHPPTEAPKIIQEGRPMLNDSAQVHARPILGMSEQVPQLPVEYPSAPRAQPNEQLEFFEPEVAGGGSEPVAIVRSSDPPEEVESDDVDEEEDSGSSVTRIEGGEPTEREVVDYSHHNSAGDNLPMMKFDKVEEGGLADVAAAMEISTSSTSRFTCFSFISIVFYLLI